MRLQRRASFQTRKGVTLFICASSFPKIGSDFRPDALGYRCGHAVFEALPVPFALEAAAPHG
ncbi:hypothetical protein SJ05684_c27900 [Sinorhizobium sojae CCBAU 05684]|uniref:Uncharacterized protein n=1 Tax=Sinorhizobium sojae CCBAU 05684 TaxID=716928 RepID=A0A249PE62_9HYPH|nr:hypothetical protein SJ05684_c27900 [Sinorhizobium sojae CCBAU 05684]